MPPGITECMGVRLGALEEEVQVVLPGKTDPAMDLKCRGRHPKARIPCVRLRHRRGARGGLRLVIDRPGGPI